MEKTRTDLLSNNKYKLMRNAAGGIKMYTKEAEHDLNSRTSSKIEKLRKSLNAREDIKTTRAEHKIIAKEHKLHTQRQLKQIRQREREALDNSKKRKWFNFFTKWFFLGLILILISITVSTCADPLKQPLNVIATIFSELLSTIGIALMIGSIFDFSRNSEAFVAFISNILSDIVVSKTFLTTLSGKDKEKALSLILKPSDKQVEQYSNINALFSKRISELTTMFDTNFKTNVILNIHAYKSSDDGRVYCQTVLTQTIYKIRDSFSPIEVHFEKSGSESCEVYVLPPTGKSILIEGNKQRVNNAGIDFDVYTYEIPKECEKYDHLTIKRTMIEPGYDHWINYYWQSLTPYEGVTCTIDCANGLTIKDYMIFDNKAYYHVVLAQNKERLEITSSQWLDMDTGFVVTIADSKG